MRPKEKFKCICIKDCFVTYKTHAVFPFQKGCEYKSTEPDKWEQKFTNFECVKIISDGVSYWFQWPAFIEHFKIIL